MNLKKMLIISAVLVTGIMSVAQVVGNFSHSTPVATSGTEAVISHSREAAMSAVRGFETFVNNPIAQQRAVADEGVEIYAFTEFNNVNERDQGLFKFNSANPGKITRVKTTDNWATAGAYAEEKYYVMVSVMSYMPTLYTVDLETGDMHSLVACSSDKDEARQALEMSYDVVDRKMYMIAFDENDQDYNTGLYTVDLETGVQSCVIKNMGRHVYALAINAEGVMYGVDGSGDLLKINKENGECTVVGNTGLRPFYRQSMDFDRETGIVYWAHCNTQRYGVLYTLDVTTATPTYVGPIGKDEQQVVGMHVPYSLYFPDAPSFVTDLDITPDAGGLLSATLSWTCPSTTVDGDNLESIDKIEISRDGKLVATLTDAAPGATMTWVDNVEAAATYVYKVQAVNSVGRGELRTVTAYVGRDVPAAATGLHLTRSSENSITLSWDNVVKGANGGYIDVESLRYNVVRTSDNKVLATDLNTTTFTDNTITELNRYRYAIESYNVDGNGGVVNSGYIVNGPARELPVIADFDINDETEPNLWSVGDANADGISFFWNYDENYNWGAYYYQTLSVSGADDWLISPPMRFEANMSYKVVVDATSANPSQPERFSVYLIENYNLSTAIALGEPFDVTSFDSYRVNFDSIPAGNYSVAIRCTSDALANYLAIYRVEVAENGDGNIRGDVWDDSSHPIENVYVSVDGTELGAYTDERGFFEISNVPAGTYTLNCVKMGYKSVPQEVTVRALKDVNVELDVIKRRSYTVSGSVSSEYAAPLANAVVSLEGYNSYSAITDTNGAFTIDNVYEADTAYNLIVEKDFYTTYMQPINVESSGATVSVTLNDSILAPALAVATLTEDNKKSRIEWSRTGIDEAVARYSGEISYTFGASDGTFGTLIGVVCHEPVILTDLHWLLLSTEETINVVVLALDENGNVTDKELYVDADAPNVTFDLSTYEFDYDVYAPNGCFIGLSCDEGFLDLATAVNTAEKPFVPQFNAYIEDYLVKAEMEFVETLGSDFCENFIIGYNGLALATDQAPVVSYNVYRENKASMSEVVLNEVNSQVVTDDAWLTLPEGDYQYAVTAVYANKKESARTYTDKITLDKSGITDVDNDDFVVTVSADGSAIQMTRIADCVMLYTADGSLIAQQDNTDVLSVGNCRSGVYMLRAYVAGVWYVEKILIK